MKISKFMSASTLVLAVAVGFTSCKKDDKEEPMEPAPAAMQSSTYNYEFNNGQVIPSAAYDGTHKDNLTASMIVNEKSNGKAEVVITLTNTVSGATYNMHAHDAADPTTTPNGTPYNETPNDLVLAKSVTGNGGSISVTQETNLSYTQLIGTYSGFFVVHDALQPVSTTDISTYLVVGSFARAQAASNLANTTFNYAFNTGQVSPQYAYDGAHANTLSSTMKIQALGDGSSRVTITLNNTLNAQTYNLHAHDSADPNQTPNGTPYDETPNADLLAGQITGNGGAGYYSQLSSLSYAEITANYSGFFVVHDPLQAVSTTDPTTYVILGSFAR
jgi:hypothetical protein